MSRNWLAVASAEHVEIGRSAGFMQVCHGKASPLRRVQPGDRVVDYSPNRLSTPSHALRGHHPALPPSAPSAHSGRYGSASIPFGATSPGTPGLRTPAPQEVLPQERISHRLRGRPRISDADMTMSRGDVRSQHLISQRWNVST
jgi:hypothetical protein